VKACKSVNMNHAGLCVGKQGVFGDVNLGVSVTRMVCLKALKKKIKFFIT